MKEIEKEEMDKKEECDELKEKLDKRKVKKTAKGMKEKMMGKADVASYSEED